MTALPTGRARVATAFLACTFVACGADDLLSETCTDTQAQRGSCDDGRGERPEAEAQTDSDGDGFLDSQDPAPRDARNPGDFSTPEAILANPRVQTALQQARTAGVQMTIHTDREAADVSGLYLRAAGEGEFIATSNGADVGGRHAGAEQRITVEGDRFDQAEIQFGDRGPAGYAFHRGGHLRGVRNEVTFFALGSYTCTTGSTSFKLFNVAIKTATRDPATGDLRNVTGLVVTVATEGALTDACRDNIAAEEESVGGWAVARSTLTKRIAANQVEYACEQEGRVFFPTESWARGKERCTCSDEYELTCS